MFVLNLQEEYEHLTRKIEDAARKSIPCQLDGEFAAFSNSERTNHPTIIKVPQSFVAILV